MTYRLRNTTDPAKLRRKAVVTGWARVHPLLRHMGRTYTPNGARECASRRRHGPYAWSCATCTDLGWIDQRAGGAATSGWAVCPDCGNPHGGSHP